MSDELARRLARLDTQRAQQEAESARRQEDLVAQSTDEKSKLEAACRENIAMFSRFVRAEGISPLPVYVRKLAETRRFHRESGEADPHQMLFERKTTLHKTSDAGWELAPHIEPSYDEYRPHDGKLGLILLECGLVITGRVRARSGYEPNPVPAASVPRTLKSCKRLYYIEVDPEYRNRDKVVATDPRLSHLDHIAVAAQRIRDQWSEERDRRK